MMSPDVFIYAIYQTLSTRPFLFFCVLFDSPLSSYVTCEPFRHNKKKYLKKNDWFLKTNRKKKNKCKEKSCNGMMSS